MKNILRVFQHDLNKIRTNVIAIVVLIGLTIIPSLYAWFNILSNWDPYGSASTSRIQVAVATDDSGTNINGIELDISTKIIDSLKGNDTIGWVFPDSSQEAIDGVYSGDYYAALIIPADFSSNMVSFLSSDLSHPEIQYYCNQKKNAIAPKITDKAKTAVKEQVNSTLQSIISNNKIDSLDGLSSSLSDNLSTIQNVLSSVSSIYSEMNGNANDFSAAISNSRASLIETQTLLIVLGNMFYIRIQCKYPIRFCFACSVASFVFTLFMYSLTVAFENIGEALAIIIMVIQVAGSGGTFPIEVLPSVYQSIYKYLPFPYAMDALRETIGGLYGSYYWKCLGSLCIYVLISLLIGLVLYKPFMKMNEKIEHSKKKSGVML